MAKKEKKQPKQVEELKQAALPLIKYLNENENPHVVALVDNTSVELLEGKTGVFNIEEFLKD